MLFIIGRWAVVACTPFIWRDSSPTRTLHIGRLFATKAETQKWPTFKKPSNSDRFLSIIQFQNSNVTFSKFTFWVFQEFENSVIIVVSQVTDVSNNYQVFHVSTLCAEFLLLLFEVFVFPILFWKQKNIRMFSLSKTQIYFLSWQTWKPTTSTSL